MLFQCTPPAVRQKPNTMKVAARIMSLWTSKETDAVRINRAKGRRQSIEEANSARNPRLFSLLARYHG
jgi:hypothetical protein